DLVGLQMPDQVPLGTLDRLHLRQRFLDPVLPQDGQTRVKGLTADVGTEPFGDGDDGDLIGIATRKRDALAHRDEVCGDAHRNATIAPNREPSGWRRWEGKR